MRQARKTGSLNKKLCVLAFALAAALAAGCGGGGGGGSSTPAPVTPTGDMFLIVTEPASSGKIYSASSVTVQGQALAGSTVTVNGSQVTLNSDGSFSRAVSLSTTSNPTTITIAGTGNGTTYTVSRQVYYQNQSRCTLVYAAKDPSSGRDRIYDYDPAIPGSARAISPDTANAVDSSPALSPDRTVVMFVRDINGTQSLMKSSCADSSINAAIATGARYSAPSWSPNGFDVAFSSDAAGNYEVYIMSNSGAGLRRVTTHAALDDSPVFTADGATLVFSSNRDTAGGAGVAQKSQLWKVSLSPVTGTPALLYNAAAGQGPTCPQGAGNCSALNPDLNTSDQLVFQFESSCGTTDGGTGAPAATCNNLYTMPMNTPTAITRIDWNANNYHTRPRWNTAGNAIVFLRTAATGVTSVMQASITGGVPGAVSETGLTECSGPDW